jgi:hypothetical protein
MLLDAKLPAAGMPVQADSPAVAANRPLPSQLNGVEPPPGQ